MNSDIFSPNEGEKRFLYDNYGGCTRLMKDGDYPILLVDDYGNWSCRIVKKDGNCATYWGRHNYEDGDLTINEEEEWEAEAACFPKSEYL